VAEFISVVKVNPNIDVDRARFPFTLPSLREFQSIEIDPKVTFFIGENGSGKSTLLEAIAVHLGFPAEGGRKDHHFSTHDSHSELHDQIVIGKRSVPGDTFFFRSESFYNVSTYLERAARDVGLPPRFGFTHQRSHGEGFLDVLQGLKGDGLYLLDEPESALSIQGQLTFLSQMRRLLNEDSQFVIATHSPIVLGFPGARIYRFSESGIEKVSYEETESYRLTFDFLKNRERYVHLMDLE